MGLLLPFEPFREFIDTQELLSRESRRSDPVEMSFVRGRGP
jgi:hypothetical protein